jgi:ABC-type multidrug transport system permease subunit
MKAVWALARKELRLLLRDRMAAGLLLGLPLLFILVLGLLLGEGFGQKSDDRLRVSLVDLDTGPCPIIDNALLPAGVTSTAGVLAAPHGPLLAAAALYPGRITYESWSLVVRADLAETAGIKLEVIPGEQEARQLIRDHKRAAVLLFRRTFSRQMSRCSFLVDGLNPFHRDGVYMEKIHVELLSDETQPGASAIIEQVAQVSLLRVILPYMIGQAFSRLSDPEFIDILGKEVKLPVPTGFVGAALRQVVKVYKGKTRQDDRVSLQQMLELAAGRNRQAAALYRGKVGDGVKKSLQQQFVNYNLSGKTWADLTKSKEEGKGGAEERPYVNQDGSGLLKRGAQRYQVLVPSYTVMFTFFLVLTVGWVFVAERRQGTLKRLRAAPLTRGQVLLGKLLPCYLVSLGQGVFLLIAGRLLFGMRWGPEQWSLAEQAGWLLLVAACTSLAAMGLALLVAALARTEMQVALFGAVPVLVLALVGGCVLPREMMPQQTQRLTLLTPQGWALAAYRELLVPSAVYTPNLVLVGQACAVLAAFGVVFLVLAWALLRLD